MTQKAAASLSSSLFARKGKASPASLLISEMEAANATNGASGRPAANGSARRRPKAEADLPLLAYVDAQSEDAVSENDNQAEAPPAEPAEIVIDAASAEQDAPDKAAKAPRASKADLPPAASLLDRGARPLRRTNGHATAVPEEASGPQPAAKGDDAPPVVEAAAQQDAPLEEAPLDAMAEAETVSGDANVAAIEDASDEDFAADSLDAAAPDDAAPDDAAPADAVAAELVETVEAETLGTVAADVIVPEDLSAVVEAADAAAAPAAKADAPPAAVPPVDTPRVPEHKPAPQTVEAARPATAVAASVALRHAKTLNADATLRAPADAKPQAVPPHPRVAGQPSRSHLWRAAAVVVLGAALGFGAYLVFAGKPAEPPAPVAAALPQVSPEPSAEPSPETSSAPAPQAQTEPEAAAPAAAVPVETAAPAAELPEPSFDIIRIEPDGQSIIAGRAEPFSEWILLNNGTPIAAVRADANGEWVVLPDASLVPGANAFSLVPKTERGKVAIPAPNAAAPQEAPAAPRADDPPAPGAVEGAVQDSAPPASDIAGVALPKAKPVPRSARGEARVLPDTIQASSGGAYEVQLASVRQTADAARERDRLASAFPDLLGSLDLRVQEAAVDGAGTFYRVRSGAIADLGLARELCRRLEAGGQGCLVVRRPAAAPAPKPATELPVTELVEEVPAEPAVSAVGQQAERPN